MKKYSSYSGKERRTIILGYLWRWGSIGMMLLVPAITLVICNSLRVSAEFRSLAGALAFGISMFCVGTYDIIGTLLEFKHVLVSLQLASHVPHVNPRRAWTSKDKREYIGVGIIFVVLGLALVAIVVFR